MGVAISKNKSTLDVFNESVTETLNQSMVQIAQQSVSTVSPTQLVKIRAAAGRDFNLSDFQQKIIVNVDVQKFISNVNETQLKSMMKSALDVTSKDNQAIDHQLTIGGSYASNTSAATIRNSNINRIVNSYSYSQFVSEVQQIMASQTVDVSGVAGRDVNIANVSQYIKVELISKQISDNMTKAFAEIISETSTTVVKETDQTSKSGFSMGWVLIIVIIAVILIAIGGAAWYFFGGGREMIQEAMKEGAGIGGGSQTMGLGIPL